MARFVPVLVAALLADPRAAMAAAATAAARPAPDAAPSAAPADHAPAAAPIGATPATPAATAATFRQVAFSANQLAATLGNYGSFGNNFVSRSSSFEYPAVSGFEHLVWGGLCVGAVGTDTAITMGIREISPGSSLANYTEWTPLTDGLFRSRSPFSPWYSADAVGDLDWIAAFDDTTIRPPIHGQTHVPLGLRVTLLAHAWQSTPYQDFVVLRYRISNVSATLLSSVWVGLFTEFASGPKSAYSTWPPSSSGSGGLGSWYSKKWLQYDAGLRLLREHRCINQPPPSACAMSVTPYWAGLALLTPPAPGQQVTLAAWNYAPFSSDRDEDREMYRFMSAGTVAVVGAAPFLPPTGDPVEMLALGPFASLAPGDSIEVAFALVGGADVADIQAHTSAAHAAHALGYVPGTVDATPPAREAAFAIRGVRPQPSRGHTPQLAFALDRAGPVRLRVLDATGRVVESRELGDRSAGGHVVPLAPGRVLAPGVYFAAIEHAGRSRSVRVAITR